MMPPCPKCHKEMKFDFWSSVIDRVYFNCLLCYKSLSFGNRIALSLNRFGTDYNDTPKEKPYHDVGL